MKAMQRRSPFSYIPGYSNNAVIQLIIACGVAFVLYNGVLAMMQIVGITGYEINTGIRPNFSLFTLAAFKSKPWTILVYGWLHNGFWELLTNMLWLYCWGNLIQVLVGHRQVIPIFIYSTVAGGIFFLLCQLIPGKAFQPVGYVIGAPAGLMGLAAAAVTLSPGYRFFIGDRLRIHILVVAGIFTVLMLMNTQLFLPHIFLLLGGGLTGYVYMTSLRKGYRPGAWMYRMFDKVEEWVTPNEEAIKEKRNKKRNQALKKIQSQQNISQKRVDDILDKINQRGYDSLSEEEKNILYRAGKEN